MTTLDTVWNASYSGSSPGGRKAPRRQPWSSRSQATEHTSLEGSSSLDSSDESTSDVADSSGSGSGSETTTVVQQLKAKREALEEWHIQHKQKQKQKHKRQTQTQNTHTTGTQQNPETCAPLLLPFRKLDRSERKQCRQIVERLQEAQGMLQVQYANWHFRQERFIELRRSLHARQEHAATRLRLSRVQRALHFYQARCEAVAHPKQQAAVGTVPIAIQQTVALVSEWTEPTLRDDVLQAWALFCQEQQQKQQQKQLQGQNHSNLLHQVLQSLQDRNGWGPQRVICGASVPHMTLPATTSSKGQWLDSRQFRGRSIVIVYLGCWSITCRTTLRAWQHVYQTSFFAPGGGKGNKNKNKKHPQHSHPVLAIAMESLASCHQMAVASGATFPILSDELGQALLEPLGLVVRNEHPMQVVRNQLVPSGVGNIDTNSGLPMTATMVVDWEATGTPTLVYSHASLDPTRRDEPMVLVRQYMG